MLRVYLTQELRVGSDARALVLDLRSAKDAGWGSAAGCAGRFAGAPPEIAACMRRIVYRTVFRPASQGGEHGKILNLQLNTGGIYTSTPSC